MRSQPVTRLSPTSIANRLRRVFGEEAVDAAARSTGFMRRKREVTPLALIVACLSSLATGGTRWLADIQRTLNASLGTAVQYKPFHNQLSKEAFPEFVRELFVQALGQLVLPVLESIPSDCLARFDDIVIQDGSSMALKDTLADVWPGRFNKISPAAVELHVTMSVSQNNAISVVLAPDKEAERQFSPTSEALRNRLFLADRGYESRAMMRSIDEHGGCRLGPALPRCDPAGVAPPWVVAAPKSPGGVRVHARQRSAGASPARPKNWPPLKRPSPCRSAVMGFEQHDAGRGPRKPTLGRLAKDDIG